jgi:hypothetical protein
MKLGLSYWGFCEEFDSPSPAKTPDGHRFGRPIFVKEMQKKGHKVYALQEKREFNKALCDIYDSGFPDIDILFVEWRWPTYKNFGETKKESDLDRQEALLSYYHGKIPVVLWDTDCKITYEDERRWPLAILADPGLNPKLLTRKRERLMFWSDWEEKIPVSENAHEYGYVGNNYDRKEQFEKYYAQPAIDLRNMGIQTSAYGNWLEFSIERDHPYTTIQKYHNISFRERVNFYESMKVLNNMLFTTHITKDEYAKHGLVTARYLESIAVNTPALVPYEFFHTNILGKRFSVRNPSDISNFANMIMRLNTRERSEVVANQRAALKNMGIFSVTSVVEYFESLIK